MDTGSTSPADSNAAPQRRSGRLSVSIALAIVAGLAPAISLLWVSRQRALGRWESRLDEMVFASIERIERACREAEVKLAELAADTVGEPTEQTVVKLQQAVYSSHLFREAGLINERGELVCTSLGLVEPPRPIAPEKRSRSGESRMQIVGLVTTEVMGERSIILSLPMSGQSEVNLLIDPVVFTEAFDQIPLGPGGFIEILTNDGRVLARSGLEGSGATSLAEGVASHPSVPGEWLTRHKTSERFPVSVHAAMSREWALREWTAELLWMTPLVIAAAAALAILVLRLGERPASLRDDLRRALRRNEFEAHYQPIVDLGTRNCIGAEALIRWNHPREGLVRPDVFIGVAEDSGLIEPLTEWLIDRVAKDLAELLRHRTNLHIGINLAPRHFNSRDIVHTLQRVLRPYQLPLERVTLEMTERGMVGEDIGLSRDVMDSLRSLGARIALDDFGTGYSSLAYLHTFRFDTLKIDASFVRRIGLDSISAGVIDAIIDLGHALDVSIIAEGVESKQQFDFLHQRGVHAAQGWYFAKAMPAAEFIRYVLQRPSAVEV